MSNSAEQSYKVRLLLAYGGSNFFGWQKQPSEPATVQGHLEKVLSRIFDQKISIVGAGRTDAKVHAIGQHAHFWAPKNPAKYKLQQSLQALIPPAIVIRSAWLAPENFHALGSAENKIYKYFILNRQLPNPFRRNYITWEKKPLNLEHLQASASFLVGTQDFASFQNTGTEVPSTVRTILWAKWQKKSKDLLEFTICADGFLKQMVRNIVGTSLKLALSGDNPNKIKDILDEKDRRAAAKPAPPEGLYLYRVKYPNELDNECRRL
jgi:tRNA pseudouridine38-40 synthase